MSELTAIPLSLNDGRKGIIRSAQESDAQATLELYRSIVDEGQYTLLQPGEVRRDRDQEARNIRDEQISPAKLRLVAEVAGKVVGMARVSAGGLARTAHFGEIDSVWVERESRRQGIGKALMQQIEIWARESARLEKLGLYVFSTNERAIQLYRNLGFEVEGRCPRDIKFAEGEYADTIVMGKLIV